MEVGQIPNLTEGKRRCSGYGRSSYDVANPAAGQAGHNRGTRRRRNNSSSLKRKTSTGGTEGGGQDHRDRDLEDGTHQRVRAQEVGDLVEEARQPGEAGRIRKRQRIVADIGVTVP